MVCKLKPGQACPSPATTAALAAHLGGEAEQEIGRVDVLTGMQAIELDWLKGNKFHEGLGQALHYGDVTGQHGLFIKSVATPPL